MCSYDDYIILRETAEVAQKTNFFQNYKLWVPREVEIKPDGTIVYPLSGYETPAEIDLWREKAIDLLKKSGWIQKELDGEKLIEDFYKLADLSGEQLRESVQMFILKYGPLWLKTGFSNYEIEISAESFWTPFLAEDRRYIWDISDVEDPYAWRNVEHINDYSKYSRDYRDALLLSLRLRVSAEYPYEPEELIEGLRLPFASLGAVTCHKDDVSQEDFAKQVQKVINKFLSINTTDKWFLELDANNNNCWELKYTDGWGFVYPAWFLLANIVSGCRNVAVCSACGRLHFREKAPKRGQNAYCPLCSKAGIVSRKQYEKKMERDKRKDQ